MNGAEESNRRYTRGQELVEEFLWRFGYDEDYRVLACHAALPLVLPPDLLRFLRHEFLPHLSWVAEVDLLLSKLCDEASEDVYVMKREPRIFLIDQMRQDPKLGEARIEAVHRLLISSLDHLMRTNPGILPYEWRAQHWSAMLYLADQRDKAARALSEAIYHCIERSHTGLGEANREDMQAELVRLTRLVRDAAVNLKDYPDLIRLAELTGQIIADRSGRFTEQLRQTGQLSQKFRLPGVAVEVSLERVILTRSGKDVGIRISAIASPLYQLPPPLSDFIGRATELAVLTDAISQGDVIIWGPGGIGKTTLALQLAHSLRDTYPDAQLYLDLGGVGQHSLTPADVMANVIRAWQPTSKLPDNEAGLRALYQSVLQDRRALLLLDDVGNPQQVEQLIAPPSCRLLMTSRQSLDLRGINALALGGLPPREARLMLQQIAPHVGGQAATIAEQCGYLPLALRVAGGTLAGHDELSANEYLKRIAAQHKISKLYAPDIRDVGAPLMLAYRLLTVDRQQQWLALAVFPHTFSAEDAAAIWGTDTEAATRTLSDLAMLGLLESNAIGRYWLHDLLVEFAESHLRVDKVTAARRRHATRFLNVMKEANDEYLRGGDSIFNGLAKFDREWENIKAGQAWASEMASQDREAAQLCIVFPIAGEYLLDLRRPLRERFTWLQAALDTARRSGTSQQVGHLLGNLAHAYATTGDASRAVELYEEALTLVRKTPNKAGAGYILSNLGSNYMRLGELQRATSLFEEALAMSQEVGDRRTEGQALSNLGRAFELLGDTSRALDLYEQHLSIARQLGDLRGESQALGNFGLAYIDLGEPQRALELHQQQLAIAQRLGDRKGEGHALENQARAFDLAGNIEEAIASAETALSIFEELELPKSESIKAFLSDLRRREHRAEDIRVDDSIEVRAEHYFDQGPGHLTQNPILPFLEQVSEADQINYLKSKPSNFIFLFGKPGVGKTSILASLIHYLTTVCEQGNIERVGNMEGRRLSERIRYLISANRFPDASSVGTLTQLDCRFVPTKKNLSELNFTFLEMSGEDLKQVDVNLHEGRLPDNIDVFFKVEGLSLTFILVTSHDRARADDSLMVNFLDYLLAKSASYREARVLLLISKWDEVPGDIDVEDFIRTNMPQTFRKINRRGTNAFRQFSLGSVNEVDGEPFIERYDAESPEKVFGWLYKTLTGKNLFSWVENLRKFF